jgi:hypothetical protein
MNQFEPGEDCRKNSQCMASMAGARIFKKLMREHRTAPYGGAQRTFDALLRFNDSSLK